MVVHTLCSAPVRTAAISWACAVGVACSLGDEARRPVYDVAGTQSGLAHLQQKVRPPSSAVGTRSDPAARSHYGESSAWDRAQCAPRPVRRGRCFNGALMSRGKGSARSVVGSASLVLDHHHLSPLPLPLPPFPPPPTPPSEPLATPAPPVTASKRKHLEAIAQLGEPVIPVPKNLKRAKRDAFLLIHPQREQVGAGRPQDRGTIIRCATPYLDIGLVFHYGSQARRVPPSPTDPTLSKDPALAEGEEDIADSTLKTLVKGTLKLTYHKWPARFYADDSYKASDPRKGLSFAATSFCGPAYVDGAQLCVQRCHKSQACQQRSPGRRLSSPEMIVYAYYQSVRCPRDNSRLLYYALQWNYYASSLGGLVTLKLECSFVSLCRLLSCIYSGPNLSHIQCPAFCSVAQFNIFYSLLFILDGPEIGMSQIGLENGFKGVKRLGMRLKVLAPFGDDASNGKRGLVAYLLDPPVVHGDVKAAWFAPEVCIGQGVLSLSSDVYAYGMTVLEHTTEVVIRSAEGELPARPRIPESWREVLMTASGCCWVNAGFWNVSPASSRQYRNGGQKYVVSIKIAFTSSNSAQFFGALDAMKIESDASNPPRRPIYWRIYKENIQYCGQKSEMTPVVWSRLEPKERALRALQTMIQTV
ncbi:hypothetical protein C8J57DRAFT_1232061 [Mycena rebaudengoi]|nr:hypothetical protein C8J57DRAFT_1232061 [Mycena rebaudengoi]